MLVLGSRSLCSSSFNLTLETNIDGIWNEKKIINSTLLTDAEFWISTCDFWIRESTEFLRITIQTTNGDSGAWLTAMKYEVLSDSGLEGDAPGGTPWNITLAHEQYPSLPSNDNMFHDGFLPLAIFGESDTYILQLDGAEGDEFQVKIQLNGDSTLVNATLIQMNWNDRTVINSTFVKGIGNPRELNVNIGEETFNRTTAQYWDNNYKINLEKSLKVGDEISGHFVYGHVDTILKILNIEKLSSSWNFYFSSSSLYKYTKFIVEKGSISINGISLTIANVKEDVFNISIIPHTYNNTNLSNLKIRDSVNIEFDALARYILSNDD